MTCLGTIALFSLHPKPHRSAAHSPLAFAVGAACVMAESRGPMQRVAVLEEMIRILPPEVAAQVEDIEKDKPKTVKAKPSLQRSAT